jgi:hypothetical protein
LFVLVIKTLVSFLCVSTYYIYSRSHLNSIRQTIGCWITCYLNFPEINFHHFRPNESVFHRPQNLISVIVFKISTLFIVQQQNKRMKWKTEGRRNVSVTAGYTSQGCFENRVRYSPRLMLQVHIVIVKPFQSCLLFFLLLSFGFFFALFFHSFPIAKQSIIIIYIIKAFVLSF